MSACGKYNTEFAKLLLARQDVNIDLKDKVCMLDNSTSMIFLHFLI